MARSGTERSTYTQHNHNNQRSRLENQADAVACRQGFEIVKKVHPVSHLHVWFVASGIDLEFDMPSIRKGFSRIQFVRSKRFSFPKSCDLTEHGGRLQLRTSFPSGVGVRAARQRGPIHAGSFRFSRSAHCHIILLDKMLVRKTQRAGNSHSS